MNSKPIPSDGQFFTAIFFGQAGSWQGQQLVSPGKFVKFAPADVD
jgi:hypothetical protein